MAGQAKTAFPHLTDTEAVRQEAASQYGGLNDAAALVQSHKAGIDPNVEAAAMKRVNVDATEGLGEEFEGAQEKVDAEFGEGTFRVLSAAVRGEALSAVVEDRSGRTSKVVVGWTSKFRALPRAEDAEQAQREADEAKLGARVRAEIDRRVQEATADIRSELEGQFAKLLGQLRKSGDSEPEEGGEPVGEQEQTPEEKAAEDGGGGDEVEGGHWPSTHDALDEIAARHSFAWPDGVKKVDEKQDALSAAGFVPDPPGGE